jgi:hypothetical protein
MILFLRVFFVLLSGVFMVVVFACCFIDRTNMRQGSGVLKPV